jgi:hypothetical protein
MKILDALQATLAALRRGLSALATRVHSAWRALARGCSWLRHNARLGRALRACAHMLRKLQRSATCAALIAGLLLGLMYLCIERIPPATIGVLESQWGGGIVERDLEPGLHFGLRGWHAWHHLDRRTHFAFFGASEQGAEAPILDLRTKEGNEIKVSVVVPYRIMPGEAHLLVRDGLRSAYVNLVRATIRDVLMKDLAELTAGEFASTDARSELLRASLPRLNVLLARYHVQAEAIEIHQVEFWKQYEHILQLKQLTRQKALLAKAATLVEEEMRKNTLEQDIAGAEMRIRGGMDKQIELLRSEGKFAISRVRSEFSEYDRMRRAAAQSETDQLLAAADQALYEAESLKQRLSNAAFDSAGGRIDLARQGAANLRIAEVVLNSNDPNIAALISLERLGQLLFSGQSGR